MHFYSTSNIYVALCTAAQERNKKTIYTWYLQGTATRGPRSILNRTGGPGRQRRALKARPSDILQIPLPSQKRKG